MIRNRWAVLMGREAVLHAPDVPIDRLKQVMRSSRRRIDDAIEDVFQNACTAGDFETADELIAVLANMRERRIARYGKERRISDLNIVRVREILRQRRLINPIDGIPSPKREEMVVPRPVVSFGLSSLRGQA